MKTLIILAGGASTRMKSSAATDGLSVAEVKAANITSKCLIVLEGDDRPVLDYLIKNAVKAGFEHILLITGTANEDFKTLYGNKDWNRDNLGVKIDFAVQAIPQGRIKPHGTADAICQALQQYPELKQEAFAVCNSDNLYSVTALEALQQCTANNAFIAYDREGLVFPAEKIARFALCKLDIENRLVDIVEKPDLDKLESYRDAEGTLRVSMNIFKFHGANIFEPLKNCPEHPQRKEKELPTAIMNMIGRSTAEMQGIPLKEHVPDLTTKADIAEFKSKLNRSR